MNRPGIDETVFNPFPGGLGHLSFRGGSKEVVEKLAKRLAEAGYEILDGPRTTGDGYYESTVKGLENNFIEITV